VLAVALLGSAKDGSSDSASDVDMAIYWRSAPERAVLEQFKTAHGTGDYIFFFGDPAQGGCAESYRIGGIKHDFAHSTLELWHAESDSVLEQLNLDTLWQKGMHGTLDCLPLYGAEVIAGLQARLRPYPETLRLAMLGKYCRFMPQYALSRQALGRGDLLFFYQLLVEYENNILFTLCALNGVYHAMEFKRLHRFVEAELPIAPPKLAQRLDAVLRAEPPDAVAQVDLLVSETLELVARHCPAFDLTPVRKRYEIVG
jgi:hypothetical protein